MNKLFSFSSLSIFAIFFISIRATANDGLLVNEWIEWMSTPRPVSHVILRLPVSNADKDALMAKMPEGESVRVRNAGDYLVFESSGKRVRVELGPNYSVFIGSKKLKLASLKRTELEKFIANVSKAIGVSQRKASFELLFITPAHADMAGLGMAIGGLAAQLILLQKAQAAAAEKRAKEQLEQDCKLETAEMKLDCKAQQDKLQRTLNSASGMKGEEGVEVATAVRAKIEAVAPSFVNRAKAQLRQCASVSGGGGGTEACDFNQLDQAAAQLVQKGGTQKSSMSAVGAR